MRCLDTHTHTLTHALRTIPCNAGGVAGGSKYIVHNILFKFALDTEGLYGGNDAAAATVGGHELKGLQAYFNCNIPNLALPLMALVDYRGFRVIAISLLPIDDGTIVYGSNDGGKTMHCKSDTMTAIVKRTAEILNLKPHLAGLQEERRVMVYSAADLEGHRGRDGRYYLIDFSRTFPCETPQHVKIKGINLTNLFRPEFVKRYSKPLCSDAYSNFTDRSHNDEIDAATKFLQWELIPRAARELPEMLANHEGRTSTFRVTERIHSRGINVRWLGAVYVCLSNMTQTTNHAAFSQWVINCRSLLVVEMFARAIKNDLRRRLRTRYVSESVSESERERLLTPHLNPTHSFYLLASIG